MYNLSEYIKENFYTMHELQWWEYYAYWLVSVAQGIVAESPQRSADLERIARPCVAGVRPKEKRNYAFSFRIANPQGQNVLDLCNYFLENI